MSKDVGELLKYGDVTIGIDLFPSKDMGKLKQELQNILVLHSNKKIKNVLEYLFHHHLLAHFLSSTNIDGETFCHSVRSEETCTYYRNS